MVARSRVTPGGFPDAAVPSLAGIRVLVVDDDEATRYSWVRYLTRTGAAVTGVPDGHSALQALTDAPTDVLIVDLRLPDIDGVQLLTRVHSVSPGVVALAVTGSDETEHRERALRGGFNAYIAKPVDPLGLAREVARLLRCR
jgi:CheY-like chemotaxis protein